VAFAFAKATGAATTPAIPNAGPVVTVPVLELIVIFSNPFSERTGPLNVVLAI
jgi:hypothetical protein